MTKLQCFFNTLNVNDKTYFIQSSFNEDLSSAFLVTDAVTSWEGTVDRTSLEVSSKETNTSLKEYCSLMMSALSGVAPHDDTSFHCDIEEKNDELIIEWKRVQGEIKFCLGTIQLKNIANSTDSVKKVLLNCNKNIKALSSSLKSSEEANTLLRKEHEQTVQDLVKCSELKQSLETELFSKFVLVINEKKKKIRALQQRLVSMQSAANFDSNPPHPKEKSPPLKDSATDKDSSAEKTNKTFKRNLDDSLDIVNNLPKRKRQVASKAVLASLSPEKTIRDEPIPVAKFPSDINTTTSSDSTIDVDDLLQDA